MQQYRDALVPREEALRRDVPSRAAAHQAFVETSGRLCTSLLAVGDVDGALGNCERNRGVADDLLATDPQHAAVRGMRAANGIGFGNVLRMVGRPEEASRAFADAIARHEQLLEANATNAELRRRLAVTYGLLATVQIELKEPAAAAGSLAHAIGQLTALTTADPENVRSAPELAYFLNRRAQTLVAVGRMDEARRDASRAIDLLRVATERAGAGGDAFNEYAWALVSYQPADVRNPRLAIEYARKALERAGSPNPVYLHTLGWAQYLTGARAEAVTTLRQALTLLQAAPPGPAVGLRKQIEGDLKTFNRAHPLCELFGGRDFRASSDDRELSVEELDSRAALDLCRLSGRGRMFQSGTPGGGRCSIVADTAAAAPQSAEGPCALIALAEVQRAFPDSKPGRRHRRQEQQGV